MAEEGSLKSMVEDWLQIQENAGKLKHLRLNAGDFIEVRGNSRRRVRGCPPGTADLEVIISGRTIFLELKSSKGKQTKEQKEFEHDVKAQGCEYHIVRSFENLQEVIK